MENKYIDIDGAKLFYKEKNSDALHTLFFFHGNSSSHRTWQQQFNSSLLSYYRLIAFDLPAHGFSDSASEITDGYSLPGIARLMVKAVMELADGKPYMLAGVSLGTNIIAEMMAYDLDPQGIVLAGPCIISREYTADKIMIPGTKIGVGFIDKPADEDLLAVDKLAVNHHNEEKTNLFIKDFKAVKDEFRSRTGHALAAGIYSDEIELIRKKAVPVFVLFGAADPAIYPDYLDKADLPLWENKIVKLSGAGHWLHLDEPELFTQLVADFASGIFTKAGS